MQRRPVCPFPSRVVTGAGTYLEDLVGEVLGVRAGEPDAHLRVHVARPPQQLGKGQGTLPAGLVHGGEPPGVHRVRCDRPSSRRRRRCIEVAIVRIRVDVLAQQGHLPYALVRQRLQLVQDRLDRPGALSAPVRFAAERGIRPRSQPPKRNKHLVTAGVGRAGTAGGPTCLVNGTMQKEHMLLHPRMMDRKAEVLPADRTGVTSAYVSSSDSCTFTAVLRSARRRRRCCCSCSDPGPRPAGLSAPGGGGATASISLGRSR